MKKKPHIPQSLAGLLSLLLVVGLLLIGVFLINRWDPAHEHIMNKRARVREVRDSLEHAPFVRDSLHAVWAQQKEERAAKRAAWEARQAKWMAEKMLRDSLKIAEQHIEIRLHPFDPNKADSTELVHLGLRPWMARSVVHYREKGGRFRTKEKFRATYGMTDSLFATLEPYIEIVDTFAPAPFYVSRKRDTILCLNAADTASLQMIRGIGKFSAVQIVRYRERLGGFVSPEQLREVERLKDVDSLICHFTADTSLVRKLCINRLSEKVMTRHPYLSFEQAVAICNYRHRKGAIHDEETLLRLREKGEFLFSEDDLKRLRPYISFEE